MNSARKIAGSRAFAGWSPRQMPAGFMAQALIAMTHDQRNAVGFPELFIIIPDYLAVGFPSP
jgi:hypothetical protein